MLVSNYRVDGSCQRCNASLVQEIPLLYKVVEEEQAKQYAPWLVPYAEKEEWNDHVTLPFMLQDKRQGVMQ